jgi:hypothetical protein
VIARFLSFCFWKMGDKARLLRCMQLLPPSAQKEIPWAYLNVGCFEGARNGGLSPLPAHSDRLDHAAKAMGVQLKMCEGSCGRPSFVWKEEDEAAPELCPDCK